MNRHRPDIFAAHALVLIPCVIAVMMCQCSFAQVPPPAQSNTGQSERVHTPVRPKTSEAPAVVEVQPVARDDEIAARLKKILIATGWFQSPEVTVDEGVVFLKGQTEDEQYKTWAANLATKTRDVVAVVNKIEISHPSIWNFQPALTGVQELERDTIFWIP